MVVRAPACDRVGRACGGPGEGKIQDLRVVDCCGAKLRDCVIRGSSLDQVLGVESLSGVSMPWSDVVGSAAALASALGIAIESD